MILEIEDITERKSAFGHAKFPIGKTLGEVLDSNPRGRAITNSVVQCFYNGARIDDWRNIRPDQSDRIKLILAPTEPVTAFIAGFASLGTAIGAAGGSAASLYAFGLGAFLGAASLVYSITSFIISLFNQPSQPIGGDGQSPTYTFEGIRTAVAPGGAVPVIYGQHIVGGQLLAMSIDVKSLGRLQQMNLLLGLGEGAITSVNCVRINNIALESIGSITVTTRLGTPSQSIITGFEKIRNTFQDGREVASGTPITYSTNGNSVVAAELVLGALDGLVTFKSDGSRAGLWIEYSIERRPTGGPTWTVVTSPERWADKSAAPIWSNYTVTFPSAGAYDLRVTLTGVANREQLVQGSNNKGRLWLTSVTERQGANLPYSGTALLAVQGVATAQFHGGRPNITSVVRGRTVLVYSTTAVSTITFSQNPAWGVLDYMTNSVYGMGAYISPSAVDIQSFIDFATLCQSQVPNGRGGLEDQFRLDIVMDQKRSHWQWIQDILGNYRSALIFSQDKFKLISDRQDLPVRQVFHAGNMVPDATEIRIASDPMRPNQVNVRFANQAIDYEQDAIFVQDSASVFGAGDPIRDYDATLIGVTRESEAIRNAAFDLNRRRQQRREVTFSTGLEGIAVEPGDMCRAGILFTDYEAGYGGRAIDGSSNHIILDREVVVKSGYAYDLFVWHTEADTVEQRTIATSLPSGTSSFATITISPTAGFSYRVLPNDRWAIGISSEDLFLAVTKKVSRDEAGRHRITVEEFRTVTPTTPELREISNNQQAIVIAGPPAQPMGVAAREERAEGRDGTITSNVVIDVAPSVRTEGGRITVPGTTDSVTLAQSHNANNGALVGEYLAFHSGAASGSIFQITAWNGSTRVATVFPPFAAIADSGDPYNLEKKGGEFAGFDLHKIHSVGSDENFSFLGTYHGTTATVPIEPQQDNSQVFRIVPFSRFGVRNEFGTYVVSLTTYGDTVAPPQPGSIYFFAGTGKDINIQVNATSYGDLWGHEFFRNHVNSFGTASLVAFVDGTIFHDTNINVGSGYFYWARPRDFSYNVGSHIGPTSLAILGIGAADIGSGTISGFAEFASDVTLAASIDPGPGLTVVEAAEINISTSGGFVLLEGKTTILNQDGQVLKAALELRVGSANDGTLLDRTFTSLQGVGGGNVDFGNLSVFKVDTPVAGNSQYKLWVVGSPGVGNNQLYDIMHRRLRAVEFKK